MKVAAVMIERRRKVSRLRRCGDARPESFFGLLLEGVRPVRPLLFLLIHWTRRYLVLIVIQFSKVATVLPLT